MKYDHLQFIPMPPLRLTGRVCIERRRGVHESTGPIWRGMTLREFESIHSLSHWCRMTLRGRVQRSTFMTWVSVLRDLRAMPLFPFIVHLQPNGKSRDYAVTIYIEGESQLEQLANSFI